MMKNTRVNMQQIMNICWQKENISKEELFNQVASSMKRSQFDHLIHKMKSKHYIYETETGLQTTISREDFQYDFDLIENTRGGENPNTMMGFNTTMIR